MSLLEKYTTFLKAILDVVEFEKKQDVWIPQDWFFQKGLSLSDVRHFFEKATKKWIIAKKDIRFAYKESMPSLSFKFFKKRGDERPGDMPYYYISVLDIDGLHEYIKKHEKVNSDVENSDDKRFPHKLPAGTIWENFIIKFLDEENVQILVQGFKHKANYKDMGFEDKRSNKPDRQWWLLFVLSKRGGELTLRDSEASPEVKKYKQHLSKILKSYFRIEYDPFKPYRRAGEKSYKIKVVLIPPEEERGVGKPVDGERDEIGKEIDNHFNQR